MFKKIMINKFNKIVIKIGSSSIIDEKTEKIKTRWLNSICKDIALLKEENKKIVIVSSGAIALGKKIITNNIYKLLIKKNMPMHAHTKPKETINV